MKINKYLLTVIALFWASIYAFGQDETYLFATVDGQELYMDEYRPTQSQIKFENGKEKPTIIFVFGGAFKMGARNSKTYISWFERLAENGYRVFSIDYRLAMKGVSEKGMKMVKAYHHAVEVGVEDLFSATAYILDNADMLGVDPNNIVVSGSSAGAMISLQAEWEICNRTDVVKKMLPEGFNYSAVMSFSGAILSDKGTPNYKETPAPTLFFHGTSDKIVNYKKVKAFNWAFFGSDALVDKFKSKHYDYSIFRFEDYGHEIAASMAFNYAREIEFLEEVSSGTNLSTDLLITESEYPKYNHNSKKLLR